MTTMLYGVAMEFPSGAGAGLACPSNLAISQDDASA
jgi:hypothetical protein